MQLAPREGMSIYFLYGIRNSNEATATSKESLNTFGGGGGGGGQNANGFALSSSSPESSNSFAHKKCIEVKELNRLT